MPERFEVLSILGYCPRSSGHVLRVTRDGIEYACKTQKVKTREEAESVLNEIRLMLAVRHPNVVKYEEAFLSGSRLNIIMEYCPKRDLRYYITRGAQGKISSIPEDCCWRLLLQMCQGLSALHDKHIIHRDLKPANIFMCEGDLLKIGDLGVAKALTAATCTTQVGTPTYMSPEVLAGRSYTFSSDYWSLGACLYELMTFRSPVQCSSLQELKTKMSQGAVIHPPPSDRYSRELVSVCMRLLSVDPLKRPSARSILDSAAARSWIKRGILPEASRPAPKLAGTPTLPIPKERSTRNMSIPQDQQLPLPPSTPKDIPSGKCAAVRIRQQHQKHVLLTAASEQLPVHRHPQHSSEAMQRAHLIAATPSNSPQHL